MNLADDVMRLPVVYCSADDELPDLILSTGEPVTWQEFHGKRNEVLKALRPFGTVGPMGEARLTSDEDGPPRSWPVESQSPEFFVIDDQMNRISRHHFVEVQDPRSITLPVLQEIWAFVRRDPRWSVGIAVPKRLYVFFNHEGVWTRGDALKDCRSVQDIVLKCQQWKPEPAPPKLSRRRKK